MVPVGWWFFVLTLNLAMPIAIPLEVKVSAPTQEACEQTRATLVVEGASAGYSTVVCRHQGIHP